MPRTLVLPVLLIASTVACLPQRDNRFDAQNAPSGELRFERCDGQEYVVVASRGECLQLFADFEDPQGRGIARYRFQLPASAGRPAREFVTETPRLPLDRTYVAELPIDELVTFQVEAVDTDGDIGTDSSDLVLENARPVALPWPETILPVGGYPWSPGVDFVVEFNGSRSSDADGDDLLYCWTFPGENEVCGPPVASASIPPTYGITAARLRVKDGIVPVAEGDSRVMTSLNAQSIVRVGKPPIWGQVQSPGLSPGRPQRLTTHPVLVLNTQIDHTVVAADFATFENDSPVGVVGTWDPLAYPSYGSRLQLVSWHDAQIVNEVSLSTLPTNIAIDRSRERIWVQELDVYLAVPTSVFKAFTVSNDQLVPAFAPVPAGQLGFAVFVATASGSLFGTDGLNVVFTLGTSGNYASMALAADETSVNPTLRPESNELWILVSSPNGSRLSVFDGSVENPIHEIDTGDAQVTAFSWIDDDEMWAVSSGEGLVRLDASALIAGVPFDDAILEFVPAGGTGTLVLSEPSGSAWVNALDVNVFVRNGSWSEFENGFRLVPAFIDLDGVIWSIDYGYDPYFGVLVRGSPGSENGRQCISETALSSESSHDPAGGVWGVSPVPRSIVHIGEDCSLLRREDVVSIDGGSPTAVPPLEGLRLAPGTRSAWAFDRPSNPTVLYRIDLSSTPVAMRTIAQGLTAETLLPQRFVPSVPDSRPGFAWAIQVGADTNQVVTVSTAGVITPRFTIPETYTAFGPGAGHHLARSPSSNRACLASIDDPTDVLNLRWIDDETGSTSLFGTYAVPAFFALADVVAGPDPDGAGEGCWAFLRHAGACDASHLPILVGTPDGGPITNFTLPIRGSPIGVVAVSSREIHLTVADCVDYDFWTRVRIDIAADGSMRYRTWPASARLELMPQ